jgi:hypothetical protein
MGNYDNIFGKVLLVNKTLATVSKSAEFVNVVFHSEIDNYKRKENISICTTVIMIRCRLSVFYIGKVSKVMPVAA